MWAMSAQDVPGPIDFVLIEFPAEADLAAPAAALSDLLEGGTIRLFDIAHLHKQGDDDWGRHDLAADDRLAAFSGAQSGLFDDEDVAQSASAMEPGTQALLIAYENSWAIPFVGAAAASGGQMIASDRIPAQVLLDALGG
jgi:hypothetical protein